MSTLVRQVQRAGAGDPSTVFGLVGAWGSGKTSILNRVRASLDADWLVADFTPWSSGDSAAMSLEFVNTLAAVLGEKLDGDLRWKLAEYAGYAAPMLAAIPFFGVAAKGVADQALTRLGSRPPWHEQFDALSQRIQELGRRVLIVVDDVDRLGGDELLTLLRVLRLLGRFRGVHYLIAYDQDTVEDLLRSTGAVGRSSAFMEKIVQYPFETPPLPRAATLRLVGEAVEELLAVTGRRLDEIGLYRLTSLVAIIAPLIGTPRSLGRFREHLLAFASHVNHGQLDVVDYVAVTWLRLTAHGVWSVLGRSLELLRSGERTTGVREQVPLGAADWALFVSESDASADVEATVALLSFMFEGVKHEGVNRYTAHDRSISDPTYFGRYLLLAIPEDDVSDELIEIVVTGEDNDLAGKMAELSAIIDGSDDALANLAISRFRAVREKVSEPSVRLMAFLAERLRARVDDVDRVAAPRTELRVLLAGEVARGITSKTVDAVAVIDLVGEDEALNLVWLAGRSPRFRDRRKEVAAGFAAYWRPQLVDRLEELKAAGKLAAVAEIVVYASTKDEIAGLLDPAVVDYESFVSLGRAFIHLAEWVGSSTSYELRFNAMSFVTLVSEAVRDKYRAELAAEAGRIEYARDDYLSRDIAPEILRAFAVDALHDLSA